MLKGASLRFDRLRGGYFARYLAGVLAICVVVMGSMVLVLANVAEGSLTTATSNGVQSVAQEVSSKVDSWVQDRERELTQLSNLISTSGATSGQAAISMVSRATTNDPFDELELVNTSGATVAATGLGGAVSLAGQTWVAGIAVSDQPYAGGVTLNSAGTDLEWLMAVPANTSNLQFYGVLVGAIGLEPWTGPGGGSNQVAGLLSGISGSGGASTSVTAVNSSGKVVYATSMGTPGKLTSAEMLAKGALRTHIDNSAVRDALSGQSGSSRITVGGTDSITGYAEASQVQWAILVSEPASQALSGVTALRNWGFVVLGAGLILAAVFAFVVAQIEVRPIRALSRAARRVSAGDLTARVSPAGAVEVATLGDAFNLMIARLEFPDRPGSRNQHRPLRFGDPPGRGLQPTGRHDCPAELERHRDLGEHGGAGPDLRADRGDRGEGGRPGGRDARQAGAGARGHPRLDRAHPEPHRPGARHHPDPLHDQ